MLCFECLTDGLPFPFAEDDATQKLTFNDTLNLLILKESNKATLRAFSTSQIGGA